MRGSRQSEVSGCAEDVDFEAASSTSGISCPARKQANPRSSTVEDARGGAVDRTRSRALPRTGEALARVPFLARGRLRLHDRDREADLTATSRPRARQGGRPGRADPDGIQKLSFHDLRHTAITHLIRSGADPAQVSRFAGHSKVSTTLDLYVGECEKRKANDSGTRLAADLREVERLSQGRRLRGGIRRRFGACRSEQSLPGGRGDHPPPHGRGRDRRVLRVPSEKSTGADREVDVVVRGTQAGHEVIVSVEAMSRSRKADREWVDQMVGKHADLPTSKLVLVSEKGFTRDARAAAIANHAVPLAPKGLAADPDRGVVTALTTLWPKVCSRPNPSG